MQAGFYLILYTLFGSFPLFGLILSATGAAGTGYMGGGRVNWGTRGFLFMRLVVAFLVKFPIYGVHL